MLFRSEMDSGMKDKLHSLLKLYQGERNVKFEEEDLTNGALICSPLKVSTKNMTYHDVFTLCDYLEESKLESPTSASKKRAYSDKEEGIEEFKKPKTEAFSFSRPKAMKAINFNAPQTSSSATTNELDLNITYDMQPPPSKTVLAAKQKSTAVTKGMNLSRL